MSIRKRIFFLLLGFTICTCACQPAPECDTDFSSYTFETNIPACQPAEASQTVLTTTPSPNSDQPAGIITPTTQPGITETPTITPSATQIYLTEEFLMNFHYPFIETVFMNNGRIREDAILAPIYGSYLTSTIGELNGDGIPDAAVIITFSRGGTSSSEYLFAVLSYPDNHFRATYPISIGGRTYPEEFFIQNQRIYLSGLERGTTDPNCCASQPFSSVFYVIDDYILCESKTNP
jgi:hypothetical protein